MKKTAGFLLFMMALTLSACSGSSGADKNDSDNHNDSDVEASMGTLSGKVVLKDKTDHGGISVTIDETSFATTTDSKGTYSFDKVPAGNYSVRAAKTGYQEKTATDQQC